MEVTEAQIARLVLGYLKKECDTAYRGFLKNSKHIPKNAEKNKYFVTRIFGLSLVEIIREYVDIYYTIQGRLEATSYFSEVNKSELARNKLIDQLLFLLNKIEYSRSSTPCSIISPVREDDSEDEQTLTIESHVKRTHASQKTPPSETPADILAENEDISEVLTQQLLKNHELHEKLAETINNVLNSPEKPLEDVNKSGMQVAIKTVVERTEADPIFEKLIEEIMGVTNERGEDERLETPPPIELSPLKPAVNEEKTIVEEQNNEAIQSIIVASNKKPTVPTSIASTATSTTNTNNEVIVFDGTLDNYLKSTNTCVPNTTQNPLFVNTGLLMMQPTSLSSTNYLVVNSQPLVSGPPAIDHDILSMPTVIVSDGKKPTNTVTKTRRTTKPKSSSTLKPLTQPTSTAAEFLTSFSTNLIDQSKHQLTTFIQPTKIPIVTSTADIPPPPPLPSVPKSSPPPLAIREPLKLIDSKETKEKQTPLTGTDTVQRVTPKSASHVRNLDFSTPPKITSTVRKLKRDEQNQAVKTLFKQNNVETQVNPTDKPKNIPIKKKTSWDEDLRQMIGSFEEEKKVQTPKKKKMTPKKKRLVAKKKRKMNVTAEEGKLLEAALKTPMKNDVVSREDVVLNEFNKSDDSNASKKLEKSDLDTSGPKTILSPSKLNVNKRTLVKSTASTPELVISISPCNSMKETPLLKTPLKVPKTPGLDVSATSNFTPFTKVIDEHLNGVDLDLIQTPSFPITPNFPTFTPSGSNLISPYSNRPTDYSTSSSYYQPSDTEQNKSLEQMMIDECNRLENKPKTPTKPKKVTVISDVTVPPLKSVVNEQMREFNQNIIGKKNLKLLKCDETSSSCSSSSSSDSSSDTSSCSVQNETVICKKSSISRVKDDIRDIIKTVEIKETLNKPVDKQKLLNDLKEKRERVKQKCKAKPIVEQKKPVRRSKRRMRDQKGKYHAAETKKKSPADRITSEEEFTLRLSSDDDTKERKSKEAEQQLKSPSDLEAENLITNLKERGIHLVHNKSPKKVLKEEANPQLIECNKLKVYDTRTYEQEDVHVVHDEKIRPSMKFSDYDLSVLSRELSANVYVEAFDIEVMIPIKVSPFTLLLDLSPKLTMKTRSRTVVEKKTDEESNSKEVDDDLMNFAIVGSVSEAGPVTSSPRTSKKRKGGSEDAHVEKKSKTENCVGILKGIDVDVFLNNIHGSH